MTNANTSTDNSGDFSSEYIQILFGAHSITKTVLGHYNLLQDDSDNEVELIERMTALCKHENINDEGLKSLQKIFHLIKDYRNNRSQVISFEQLNSVKVICQSYVNWVLETFECFEKGLDGRYYYHSN